MLQAVSHPLLVHQRKLALAAIERTSTVTDEQRREGAAKVHRQIEEGYLDIGPMADHSVPVTDIRDLRDPEYFGSAIQYEAMHRGEQRTASQRADKIANDDIPNYRDQPIDHAAIYRSELEKRAADGDKFAAALLRGESLAEDPVD